MRASTTRHDDIRRVIREGYGKVALAAGTGCECRLVGPAAKAASLVIGYSREDFSCATEGSYMGLGCGNPQGIAAMKEGETVLDLGSGGGFDCFLAARAVGKTGRVIGVDMTPEMVAKASADAKTMGLTNVEFRLGEIEALPVADGSVDVILSNCAIHLSPEKDKVFQEAFRVLKKGGRLAVSDIVATAELPEGLGVDLTLFDACISGASLVSEVGGLLAASGFEKIRVRPHPESRTIVRTWFPGKGVEDYLVSATIEAVKP